MIAHSVQRSWTFSDGNPQLSIGEGLYELSVGEVISGR
jgi:hypothetical protein